MTGVAEDIADRIVTLGFGQIISPVTIFTGEMPGTPDNAISVRELAGAAPERAMGRIVMDRPDVQVIVRRTAYTALVTAVTGIRGDGLQPSPSGLDGWHGIIDGKEYYYLELAYSPVYMGRDENQRRRTSLTFHVRRQR